MGLDISLVLALVLSCILKQEKQHKDECIKAQAALMEHRVMDQMASY